MPEAWSIVCLSLIAGCSLIVTIMLVGLMSDLRRTLKRFEASLPGCRTVLRDVHRLLHQTQQLVQSGQRVSRQVERTVDSLYHWGSDVVGQAVAARDRVRTFLARVRGNHRTRAASRPRS